VYPALVVLQSLSGDKTSDGASVIDVLWVGGEGGMEAELVQREGIPFQTIQAAGVHGVGLRALPGNLLRLWRGLTASRRLLRQYRPQVLLFTGGYVAVPMAFAARLPGLGAPRPRSLLYVPDIEPGLALKLLARFADLIAVTVDEEQFERLGYHPGPQGVGIGGRPARPAGHRRQSRGALDQPGVVGRSAGPAR
jgi:UDP-N-acetylglucosamine:LPS N-acetylglucosamine transferase